MTSVLLSNTKLSLNDVYRGEKVLKNTTQNVVFMETVLIPKT